MFKLTIFKCLTGYYRCNQFSIELFSHQITSCCCCNFCEFICSCIQTLECQQTCLGVWSDILCDCLLIRCLIEDVSRFVICSTICVMIPYTVCAITSTDEDHLFPVAITCCCFCSLGMCGAGSQRSTNCEFDLRIVEAVCILCSIVCCLSSIC